MRPAKYFENKKLCFLLNEIFKKFPIILAWSGRPWLAPVAILKLKTATLLTRLGWGSTAIIASSCDTTTRMAGTREVWPSPHFYTSCWVGTVAGPSCLASYWRCWRPQKSFNCRSHWERRERPREGLKKKLGIGHGISNTTTTKIKEEKLLTFQSPLAPVAFKLVKQEGKEEQLIIKWEGQKGSDPDTRQRSQVLDNTSAQTTLETFFFFFLF